MDKSHPFFLIYSEFLNSRKINIENFTFNLSEYLYIPDSIIDERYNFKLLGNEFNEEKIGEIISNLPENRELAFHSIIQIKGKTFHFPFIDFAISPNDWDFKTDLVRLKRVIPNIEKELVIFNSGRSLHGYSIKLLTPKEWVNFMGRLLLVDLANSDKKLIDSRWVGHRLIGGYGSLRWSNNSGNYLLEPKRIT